MGFGMIQKRRLPWLLHGLHFGLALLVPFLILLMVGCKKTKEETADYGPEVPGSSIDLALSKAIQGASLDNLSVGQYLDHSVNRRLENEETTANLGGTRVEVIDKQENETTVRYTLRIFKSERISSGEFETKVTEEPLTLNKSTLTVVGEQPSMMAQTRLSAEGLAAHAVTASPARKVSRISFHNLRQFTAPMHPPRAVAQKPGCGGLSPCEMQVRYIQFDMVQWHDDGSKVKVALDFGFSIQPPYLPFGESFDQFSGLLVLDCRSTYVRIETRTVYVRDCMTLDDFQK